MLHPRTNLRSELRPFGVLAGLVALAAVAACAEQPAAPPAAGTAPGATGAPAASDTSTGTSSAEPNGKRSASVFVVHDVSDFDAFKKFFEEGAAARAKAGVKGHLLTRLEGSRIVIHLFASDLDTVQTALNSPELQQYLNRKGAPDASLVWLAHDDIVKLPATPPAGETFSLFLKLRVADFPALERGFEQRSAVFAEQGVIGSGLHQSIVHDDLVFLHFMGTAKDKLEALPKRPEFVEWLKLAGVKAAPSTFLGVDVSRSRGE